MFALYVSERESPKTGASKYPVIVKPDLNTAVSA